MIEGGVARRNVEAIVLALSNPSRSKWEPLPFTLPSLFVRPQNVGMPSVKNTTVSGLVVIDSPLDRIARFHAASQFVPPELPLLPLRLVALIWLYSAVAWLGSLMS